MKWGSMLLMLMLFIMLLLLWAELGNAVFGILVAGLNVDYDVVVLVG